MNKRGQFFLVAAFILIGVIVGIAKLNNYIFVPARPLDKDFLKNEIEGEAGFAIDYSMVNADDMSPDPAADHTLKLRRMANFSKSYIDYSRAKMPDSQYLFIYAENSSMDILFSGRADKVKAKSLGPDGGDFFFFLYDANYPEIFHSNQARSLGENVVEVEFYGTNYSFDLRQKDFKYIVRLEDRNGVFVES